MHRNFLTQLSADHQTNLLTQATAARLLASRDRTTPRRPRPRPPYVWQFRSPVVRRPAPIPAAAGR
jgi:hypothetical protein